MTDGQTRGHDAPTPTPPAGTGNGLNGSREIDNCDAGQAGTTSGSQSSSLGNSQGGGRDWRHLRDMGIATLAWIAVAGIVFWGAAHIISALLVFILAAILAYALSPAVKHLERFMPRVIAIALVYVGILTTLSGLMYLIVITAVGQVSMLLADIQSLLATGPGGQSSPLVATFKAVGLSDAQIHSAANRMLQQVQNLTGDAVSVAASVLDAVVRTILVGVLSIYLLKDGPLVIKWLRNNTPIAQRPRVVFYVEMLDTVVGGYIRGQLTLSALIGVLVGAGMWVFHVPYAVFLGVLAFVLEFVPLVGVFVSGAICVLLALTVGWLTAVFVLAYFVIVHFIEGDIVGPRIMSKAVGLHPAVSILALFAGAELFGVWGALFAAPVAGLVQAVLRALWLEWRASHPEQFPTGYTVTPDVRIVPVTHAEAPIPTTVEADATAQPAEPLYPLSEDGALPGTLGDDDRDVRTARDNGERPPDFATAPVGAEAASRGRTAADPTSTPAATDEADGAGLLPDVVSWVPMTPTVSLYDQYSHTQPGCSPANSTDRDGDRSNGGGPGDGASGEPLAADAGDIEANRGTDTDSASAAHPAYPPHNA